MIIIIICIIVFCVHNELDFGSLLIDQTNTGYHWLSRSYTVSSDLKNILSVLTAIIQSSSGPFLSTTPSLSNNQPAWHPLRLKHPPSPGECSVITFRAVSVISHRSHLVSLHSISTSTSRYGVLTIYSTSQVDLRPQPMAHPACSQSDVYFSRISLPPRTHRQGRHRKPR